MLYDVVLYRTILYSLVLWCALLYYAALCCTMVYYIVRYWDVPRHDLASSKKRKRCKCLAHVMDGATTYPFALQRISLCYYAPVCAKTHQFVLRRTFLYSSVPVCISTYLLVLAWYPHGFRMVSAWIKVHYWPFVPCCVGALLTWKNEIVLQRTSLYQNAPASHTFQMFSTPFAIPFSHLFIPFPYLFMPFSTLFYSFSAAFSYLFQRLFIAVSQLFHTFSQFCSYPFHSLFIAFHTFSCRFHTCSHLFKRPFGPPQPSGHPSKAFRAPFQPNQWVAPQLRGESVPLPLPHCLTYLVVHSRTL